MFLKLIGPYIYFIFNFAKAATFRSSLLIFEPS